MGDKWAMDVFEEARVMASKYGKTKLAKTLLAVLFPKENTIRAWWNICKKDIALARLALRLIAKGHKFSEVSNAYDVRAGVLKCPFSRALEYLHATRETENFVETAMSGYRGLGMSQADCRERASNYMERLKKEFSF